MTPRRYPCSSNCFLWKAYGFRPVGMEKGAGAGDYCLYLKSGVTVGSSGFSWGHEAFYPQIPVVDLGLGPDCEWIF